MKPVDLGAIRERVAKATPGPWVAGFTDERWPDNCQGIWPKSKEQYYDDEPETPFAYRDDEIVTTDGGAYGPNRDDAEFIAHAREDVPDLLELVDALTTALLLVEWTETDEADEVCPACHHVRRDGHQSGCRVDATLAIAGLQDQASREAARKLIAENRT